MIRRSGPSTSSLELLLDTICNTFGGVLFLAILVCVLLRNTSRFEVHQVQASPTESLLLQERMAQLSSERNALEQALSQQAVFAKSYAHPEKIAMLQQAASLERTYKDLRVRKMHLQRELDQIRADREGKAAQDAQTQRDLRAARSALEAVRREVEDQLDARTQDLQLPRLRMSLKNERGVIVRYGRIYVWHRYNSLGSPVSVNTEDFLVLQDKGSHLLTTPKPYAGTIITAKNTDNLRSRLLQFDSRRHYLTVVVWPDSFDDFQLLKSLIVKMGFEYRLMPMREGESVFDRGGSNNKVQ